MRTNGLSGWFLWRVAFLLVLSSLTMVAAMPARAHEVQPAIADLALEEGALVLEIRHTWEAQVAGIDLDGVSDTNEAPGAETYDQLRALDPAEFEAALRAAWPQIAEGLDLRAGEMLLHPDLAAVEVPEAPNAELPRFSVVTVTAALPANDDPVTVGWPREYGALVLRQQGVPDEQAYTGYLTGGARSDPIPREGGAAVPAWRAFANYVAIGFEHILPKGLDHILFVLGLFFLSAHLRPLLWQVTAFTLAHTVTLALSTLGFVQAPAAIVEPLIAASIVYVGVENVLARDLKPWRPLVVFCFGLLHGLGFASVLGEIGLDPTHFVTGLVAFNIGVELGQLAVIAAAFLLVGWFRHRAWYRRMIANPASIAIAAVGAFWVVERTLL